MRSQQVNRYSKKISQTRARLLKAARGTQDHAVCDRQTGFIHHPTGFPLQCKRVWFDREHDNYGEAPSDIGLIFESDKYIKPGAVLEITIPLRNETERFRGKVVLVRTLADGYEIGVWLRHRDDASRVRIIEQICHIESYLQEKKYRDGPYTLNRERAAEEWISKYASSVPSI